MENNMVNNCLFCSKPIEQKNGGKERKFCDNNNVCKQAYHNKNKKEPKYVQYSTFEDLKKKYAETEMELVKLKMSFPPNPNSILIDIDKLASGVEFSKTTTESYDNKKIKRTWVNIPPEQNEEFHKPIKELTAILEENNKETHLEAQEQEIFKGYTFYEGKAKKVDFEGAEALIIEIMASGIKSWQKDMLKKTINKRFDFQ